LNLEELKGSYHVFLSLGSACNPASKLKEYNLRTFSGPLDWKVTLYLSDVNRLLKNRFQGFMELRNMMLLDDTDFFFNEEEAEKEENANENKLVRSYFVKDTLYNVISVHDFPIVQQQHWHAAYPAFRRKLVFRIRRFLHAIKKSPSILFVRWAGSYEEAAELQETVKKMTRGKFSILLLCPEDGFQGVEELNWDLKHVCALKVPNIPFDDDTWRYVLSGITLAKQ